VLGYDIAEAGGRLVVNPEESDRVKSIFASYLQHRSLGSALVDIQGREWTTKRWRTRDGKDRLGQPFTKVVLHRLLTNILYIGKVSHQGVVYAGEQPPIIDDVVWKLVSEKLARERAAASIAAVTKAREIALRRSVVIGAPVEPVTRITRLLALALKFEELIRSATVSNYAAVAQVAHVSRSRVTQMTGLLNLAPDIQEEILFLPAAEARQLRISEPSLRRLTATLLWNQQREQWTNLRRSGR
jgi:acyl-CoA thioesterase FadM